MDKIHIKSKLNGFNYAKALINSYRPDKRFKPANPLEYESWTIPICSDEGVIEFTTAERQEWSQIFSFVYYDTENKPFVLTAYYAGLLIYAEIIQRMANAAMVIYSNKKTLPILRDKFKNYPKVIFALVSWPRYEIDGSVEESVMRTLRFQATDAFRESAIAIRDADTYFAYELETAMEFYKLGHIGTDKDGTAVDDYIGFFVEKIGAWEKHFLETSPRPIVVGVSSEYKTSWHRDLFLKYPVKSYISYNGKKTDQERFGRFKNYENDPSIPLIMNAPYGVWAGLINFAVDRPSDIWALSVDYLINRFSVIEVSPKSKRLNNSGLPTHIGKDERIIIFAIMPKYLDLFYFFTTMYLNVGHQIKNARKNSKPDYYEQFREADFDYFPLLTFSGDPGNILNYEPDTEFIIWSFMLDPRYIDIVYGLDAHMKYMSEFGKMVEAYNAKLQQFYDFINSNTNGSKFKALTTQLIGMEKLNNKKNYYYKLANSQFAGPIMPINRTRHCTKGGRRRTRRRR